MSFIFIQFFSSNFANFYCILYNIVNISFHTFKQTQRLLMQFRSYWSAIGLWQFNPQTNRHITALVSETMV